MLWSFAAAQPLLDVTGRSPETFVFYRVDGLRVVAYALIVLLAVPVLLWLVVTGVAAVSRTAGRFVHALFAGTLIALIVIQLGKELPAIRDPALVLVAVVVAVAVLVLFTRRETSRRFVTYLIPAPLVFALLFLVFSPTAQLVRPAGSSASAARAATGDTHPPVVMLPLDELPLRSLLNSKGDRAARRRSRLPRGLPIHRDSPGARVGDPEPASRPRGRDCRERQGCGGVRGLAE